MCGTLMMPPVRMKAWFDLLLAQGPIYGYYPKPAKCILVVKPEHAEVAHAVFKGTEVEVQGDGAKDNGVELNVEGTRHHREPKLQSKIC